MFGKPPKVLTNLRNVFSLPLFWSSAAGVVFKPLPQTAASVAVFSGEEVGGERELPCRRSVPITHGTVPHGKVYCKVHHVCCYICGARTLARVTPPTVLLFDRNDSC